MSTKSIILKICDDIVKNCGEGEECDEKKRQIALKHSTADRLSPVPITLIGAIGSIYEYVAYNNSITLSQLKLPFSKPQKQKLIPLKFNQKNAPAFHQN